MRVQGDREHLHGMAQALVRKFGSDAATVADHQASLADADSVIAETWREIAVLAREATAEPRA